MQISWVDPLRAHYKTYEKEAARGLFQFQIHTGSRLVVSWTVKWLDRSWIEERRWKAHTKTLSSGPNQTFNIEKLMDVAY